MKTISFS